jgi:hypothetical protein
MRCKLNEFLDLQQGNHTVYECCMQFNNLKQYGAHHMNTDEKKVKLFGKGLNILLQDCLILFPTITYNTLARAAIDPEGTLRACAEAKKKKRKRVMPGPSGGSSGGGPPKYCMAYTPPVGQPCQPPQQFWCSRL